MPDPAVTRDPLRSLLQRAISISLGGALRWRARLVLLLGPFKENLTMADDVTSASEALVAMPLPKMLEGLGLAVAAANTAMAASKGPNNTVMTVTEATIDLAIAISVAKTTATSVGGKLELQAFSVNASYARTFSFKEEASSRISMKLAVVPASS